MQTSQRLTHLDQRERTAVAMLMSGETWQDVGRATGLSFGEIQHAWIRRSRRSGLSDLFDRYLSPKLGWGPASAKKTSGKPD